ncbi:MAG: hypothetical protein UR70_C0004G0024 [Candidatus Nomurabacteria bacterium GW2011_GWB1_35_20]|uniref:Uncharacterized protein n=2 Tax=Candidatus Nomuraibacteriota TaxID=1752729 RepID=A0A0G0H1C7_9BACT|nr:MAG: hypothetical protein UR70_C0004G0024 [Candidatus Nomurabacteria bacterium GW2011_GWB1_35_20]KKP75512.1 MAG: hypothetical protein UR72_C0005G0029 [Parcubacteria group bacterium GW2011_GWC1_35_21]KKP97722.1 MAG: hypothetical protein US05_C0012G0002 [Candidatus Nomurabacteria bacterium GW2011_GWA1_36_15]HCY18144.1 hypothetical protein [Candidatus Nomurabacteria bacterium]
MQKKYFYNSIISFILIVSTILMPLSFIPKKAEAQIGISGYTSGLAPAIASLPQCKEVINSGIKSLFSGIESLFSSDEGPLLDMSDLDDTASSAASSLESVASSAASQFDNINVFDTEANKKLDALKKQSEAIKQSTESLNANSTCIQSIGRLIIKMLLQKLTVSTVAWINSGFDGNPAFIQDPGKFFNDIAKNEILQFGLEINNPELFPFGRAWMQNTALAFNNKFQDNARYSLNELIQNTNPEFTAETFQQDFSQGGWNAWTAMTQVPANNPLGFKLMADNEIQRRLAGTSQSTAEQVHEALSQADGFLGDMRCVDSSGSDTGITQQQRREDATAQREDPCKVAGGNWEYVTPGKLVSEAATNVMGYQNNAYLNVEDLNDAVAAILDALLSQFSSNIMEKGFANLGNEGADGSLVYDSSRMNNTFRTQTEKDFMPSQLSSSWLAANPNFNIRTDLTQALIDEQRTYADKLKLQNEKLMSTTDGQDYKLDYDPVKKISNADGLIPVIYQLDYCIPGPHPGFEEDSRRTLAAVADVIVPESPASLADRDENEIVGSVKGLSTLAGTAVGLSITASTTAFGASLGSVAPVVGTIIGAAIGLVVGWIISLFGGDDDGFYKARLYYASQLGALTGIAINPENPPGEGSGTNKQAANIESKYASVHVLNTILDRYIYLIHKVFNPKFLPDVTREATTSYYQITGYNQMAKNNEEKISLLKTTVNLLGDIKDEVDALNEEYKDTYGQFIPNSEKTEEELIEEYENKLKDQINAFGRLSSSMVNGNDIAKADNLLKQITDKKDYIYKNLLKGPYGCEKDLELRKQPLAERIHNTKRMTYPFPILYDYNNFGLDENLPDPLNMMGSNVNKMKSDFTDNPPGIFIGQNGPEYLDGSIGPGFLSYFIFQLNSNNEYGNHLCATNGDKEFDWSNINKVSYQCELEIGDLLPMHGNPMSLGKTSQTTEWSKAQSITNLKGGYVMNGPFESIIGVY